MGYFGKDWDLLKNQDLSRMLAFCVSYYDFEGAFKYMAYCLAVVSRAACASSPVIALWPVS